MTRERIPCAQDEFVTSDLLALALQHHIGRVRVTEQLLEVSLQALDTIHCHCVVNLDGRKLFLRLWR